MNKKLTELMEDIQEDLMEEVMDEAEIREVPQVSIDRIKALATRNIGKMSEDKRVPDETYKENNSIHLETNERSNGAKRKGGRGQLTKRILIPLVAAALVVGTVAAVNYNPTLNDIFGEFFPFKDQVQPIEKSMSAEGLTFTAEGALIDKKSGLFIASFTKADGGTFEEGSEVKQMQVQTERLSSMGWGVQSSLSEDKKQLNCIIDLSSNQQLYGQKLTLEASGIRVWRNLSKVSDIKLEELTPIEIKQPWKSYTSALGLNQILVEDFKEIKLDAFYVSDTGIELITSYYDQVNIENQSTYIEMIDERTGQSYEPSQSEHYWSEKEALNKDYYVFNQFKKEDLHYLKFKVGNNYFENVLDGKWQVEFQLDKNSQTKTRHMSQTIKNEKQKLTITKVEVSALGATLEGYKGSKKIEALQEVYLKMKDGTKIDLNNTGMNTGIIKFNMYYNVVRNGENKEGQNLSKTEGLTEGITTPTIDSASDLLVYDFINIEEVQSIVLEGVEIPLQ